MGTTWSLDADSAYHMMTGRRLSHVLGSCLQACRIPGIFPDVIKTVWYLPKAMLPNTHPSLTETRHHW